MANWTKPSARDPWKVRAATRGDAAEPQVLGALSVVLRPGASSLRVSRKFWCRSSDRPTALPKRSLSDLVLATESCCNHLLTVRDCPLRWAEGQGVLTIGSSGISTRQQLSTCCHMRCVKICRRRLDHVQTDRYGQFRVVHWIDVVLSSSCPSLISPVSSSGVSVAPICFTLALLSTVM